MRRRELNNQIEYLVTCVGDFAQQHGLTPYAAYSFLKKHRGLTFLVNSYDVEHTQSIQTAVDDMLEVCRRHGGTLA